MKPNHLFISALILLFATTMSAQVESSEKKTWPNISQPPQGPTTTIKFEESEYNFGKAISGEKVWHTFVFTNTGTEPFIISNAKGSCGCTVPRWPKEPIAPGETGEIFVVFNTKNKMGNQIKTITITGNTEPSRSMLYVKGEVIKDAAMFADEDRKESIIEFKKEDIKNPEKDFTAYPNPTSSTLNLSLKDFAGQSLSIDIFNNVGQRMESRKILVVSEDVFQMNVGEYEPGLYSVTISFSGSGKITKRFLVI